MELSSYPRYCSHLFRKVSRCSPYGPILGSVSCLSLYFHSTVLSFSWLVFPQHRSYIPLHFRKHQLWNLLRPADGLIQRKVCIFGIFACISTPGAVCILPAQAYYDYLLRCGTTVAYYGRQSCFYIWPPSSYWWLHDVQLRQIYFRISYSLSYLSVFFMSN